MSVNDKMYTWLRERGYSGALNDMLKSYLDDQGYTGSLSDMISKSGGYRNIGKSSTIQDLIKEGVGFNFLDTSKMYKDKEGTQPASAEGDVVARVDSYIDGVYLEVSQGDGARLVDINGTLALRFNSSVFSLVGYSAQIAKPIIAHGTMNVPSGTNILYWYNRNGSGYGARKWGVILRSGQYRAFHNNGNITVAGVDEWDTYHDVYWNRPADEITIDGDKRSLGGSSSVEDETYEDSDSGFRLGGYSGSTSESISGIVTYFILASSPLDEEALNKFTAEQKKKVTA